MAHGRGHRGEIRAGLVQTRLAAILCAVVTTERMREFVIYTGEPGLTVRELEHVRDLVAAFQDQTPAAQWSPVRRNAAPGRDTDELADRFLAIVVDGIRGYATPR